MAEQNYKINQAIKIDYQGTGSQTGLTVQMDVYDIADALDAGQSGVMVEYGTRGKYSKSFAPNAAGDWRIEISDSVGGKAIRHFSVGAENINSIGGKIDTIDSAITNVDADVAIVGGAVAALENISIVEVNAEVDQALIDADVAKDATVAKEATVAKDDTVAKAGAGGNTLETLSNQIDGIDTAAPPMIG